MPRSKTGVITGATSGIGAGFARAFAGQGYDLILTGRRKEKLADLAAEISNKYSVNVVQKLIELSDPVQVKAFIDELKALEIDLLINNAGFGMRATFLQESVEKLNTMIAVHAAVPMQLMHSLLPGMIQRQSGIIINVASVAGFFPLPKSGVYSATKSFLTLLTESMHVELQKSGVRVQALCPGMTVTDFHSKLGKNPDRFYKKSGPMKAMTPEQVVEVSLKYLKKNKPLCVPGINNRFLVTIPRLLSKSMIYKLTRAVRDRET